MLLIERRFPCTDILDKKDIFEFDALVLAAFFHKAIYDPLSKSNESDSIALFLREARGNGIVRGDDLLESTVLNLLISTKYWFTEPRQFKSNLDTQIMNDLIDFFFRMAAGALVCFESSEPKSLARLLRYERGIYREHQSHSWKTYRAARIDFLRKSKRYPVDYAFDVLIEWLESYRPNVGVYVGSFNPFHLGHLDIIRQAEAHFDKVIVVKAINPEKDNDDYGQSLGDLLCYHEVLKHGGLTTDLLCNLIEHDEINVTLIRGLRGGKDLEYECENIYPMQNAMPWMKVQFYLCKHKNEYVSSKLIRQIADLGGDTSDYVPTTNQVYNMVDIDQY